MIVSHTTDTDTHTKLTNYLGSAQKKNGCHTATKLADLRGVLEPPEPPAGHAPVSERLLLRSSTAVIQIQRFNFEV